MRIEIYNGDTHNVIDSDNPKTIGQWFADIAPTLITPHSAQHPSRVTIWPTGDFDARIYSRGEKLTAARCQEIIELFDRWSQEDNLT